MFYRFPSVDLFSFLIGLIAGALAWLLIHQLFKLVPKLLKTIKHNREIEILEKQPEIDTWLRQQILKKCESAHFGASIIPLSEIYVDLPLQVPLSAIKSHQLYPDQNPVVYSIFPPIPQTPGIQIGFAYPTISLSEALNLNPQLVVLGEIGSGKTSLLARFASRVLTQDERTLRWNRHLPIYIHASELEIDQDAGVLLFAQLSKTIGRGLQSRNVDALSKLLLSYYERSHLLLIVDGLDEFPPEIHKTVVNWLININARYPDLPIVTTSGPFYTGSLECSGFSSFFMAPLEPHHQLQLVSQWLACISDKNSEIAKNLLFHRLHLEQSFINQNKYLSILECTLLLLRYFFGRSDNPDLVELLTGYLIHQSSPPTPSSEVIKAFFKNATISPYHTISFAPEDLREANNSAFLVECVQTHALFDLKNGSYQPIHPALILYIQLLDMEISENGEPVYRPMDPLLDFSLKLGLINRPILEIPQEFRASTGLNFLSLSTYYERLEVDSAQKQSYLAKAYQLIQEPANSLAYKIQLLTIFSKLPIGNLAQILEKLNQYPDLDCQLVSIYAYGIFNLPDREKFLKKILHSEKINFREAAIISLSRIWNAETQKICLDHFMKSNERDQRILAEIFAHKQKDGHEILKELSAVSDAKCRRAAIHGLRLIKEPWVKAIFEDLSLHDFEWNVRDAAAHALETYNETDFVISDPRVDAANVPWLLQFASRQGIGIPADIFPSSIIHQVLISGDFAEQIAALGMLARHPDSSSIKNISECAKKNRSIREYAQESLLQISRNSMI